MKTKKLTLSVVLSAIVLTTMSLFFVEKANAFAQNKNQQLQTCSVQSGDTITQIGNTCTSGGKGCKPNPCGD